MRSPRTFVVEEFLHARQVRFIPLRVSPIVLDVVLDVAVAVDVVIVVVVDEHAAIVQPEEIVAGFTRGQPQAPVASGSSAVGRRRPRPQLVVVGDLEEGVRGVPPTEEVVVSAIAASSIAVRRPNAGRIIAPVTIVLHGVRSSRTLAAAAHDLHELPPLLGPAQVVIRLAAGAGAGAAPVSDPLRLVGAHRALHRCRGRRR